MSARLLLTMAVVVALRPLPLAAKVLDSSERGFTIENTVTVRATPEAAWRALVRDVDQWWPKDHSWFGKAGKFRIEPRAGGCFCETAGKREALHMTISFADPGRLLRMLGGLGPLAGMGLTGTMEWTFETVADASGQGAGSTRITLRYVAGGYTTADLKKFAAIVDQVQGIQLNGLAKHLGAPA